MMALRSTFVVAERIICCCRTNHLLLQNESFAARLLLSRDFMHSKTLATTRASPLSTDSGYFFACIGYRKAAIMIIAVLFLAVLLITQFGGAVKFGKGVEVAFSRARQLLHDADKENRNVRPLPLSLAKVKPMRRLG
jgi:hypothetical protein